MDRVVLDRVAVFFVFDSGNPFFIANENLVKKCPGCVDI